MGEKGRSGLQQPRKSKRNKSVVLARHVWCGLVVLRKISIRYTSPIQQQLSYTIILAGTIAFKIIIYIQDVEVIKRDTSRGVGTGLGTNTSKEFNKKRIH